MIQSKPDPDFKKAIKSEKNGKRFRLTLECGHIADAIHDDAVVICLTCIKKRTKHAK